MVDTWPVTEERFRRNLRMNAHAHADEHFAGSNKLFISIWVWLVVLTLIEILLAYRPMAIHFMLTILLGLSIIKAALIVAYFMHLKFERMSLVLTLVPILVASYAVGAALTGRPLALPAEGVALLREPHIFPAAYWGALWARFWDLLLPFAVGGTVLSAVCSLAAYPVTLKLLRANQRRKNRL